MGDRRQIQIHEGDTPRLFLYTHWCGSQLPARVAAGLDRGRGRGDDDSYLIRILFDDMTDGNRETTGFGISWRECDSESPDVIVDVANQRARIEGEEWLSFEEFVTKYKSVAVTGRR